MTTAALCILAGLCVGFAVGMLIGRMFAASGQTEARADGWQQGVAHWEAERQHIEEDAYRSGYLAAVRSRPPLKRIDVEEMEGAN